MIEYKDIIGCTGSYLGAKRIEVRVSSLLILSVIVLVPVEFCNLPFEKICSVISLNENSNLKQNPGYEN